MRNLAGSFSVGLVGLVGRSPCTTAPLLGTKYLLFRTSTNVISTSASFNSTTPNGSSAQKRTSVWGETVSPQSSVCAVPIGTTATLDADNGTLTVAPGVR